MLQRKGNFEMLSRGWRKNEQKGTLRRRKELKKMVTWWMLAGWTCLCLVGLQNRYRLFPSLLLLFIPVIPLYPCFFPPFFIFPPAAGVLSGQESPLKVTGLHFEGKFPNSAPPQTEFGKKNRKRKNDDKLLSFSLNSGWTHWNGTNTHILHAVHGQHLLL